MTQLAFTIVERRPGKTVRIPGVWVKTPDGQTVLCVKRAPTGFDCCCGHGLIEPKTKRCCWCGARRVKR